jgi:glycine/serine hydroxymethyltransferase
MNKYLFADIDGVLNTYAGVMTSERLHGEDTYGMSDTEIWDINAITAFRYVQDQIPDLKIVIHSSWRRTHSVSDFKEIFKKVGLNPDQIVDITHIELSKPESISDYIAVNSIQNFVIIDDVYMGNEAHQTTPNPFNGMNFSTVADVFEILGLDIKIPVILF